MLFAEDIWQKPKQITLSSLGLGGAGLGNLYRSIDESAASNTIHTAWAHGVRYFDTAPLYGFGLSETRLGKALLVLPRHEFILSTKVGRVLHPDKTKQKESIFHDTPDKHALFDYSYDGILRSFEESLDRLQTDYIDILFIHDLGKLTHQDAHETTLKTFLDSGLRAIETLQTQKQIRAVGLGVNEWEIANELLPHFTIDYLMLAGRYTLLEQTIPQDFFAACHTQNIHMIAAGPFNSGILAGGNNYNYATASASLIQKTQAIKKICEEFNITLQQAAIQFPFLHPQINTVITGAQSPEEIRETAMGLQKKIPTELWQRLKEKNYIAADIPFIPRKF